MISANIENLNKMSEIPYTVKPSWVHRILFIVLSASLTLIFFLIGDNGEFWNSEHEFIRNLILIFYSVLVLFTIGIFIRKIEFRNNKILHRSYFGITKIKKYKDIVDVTGQEENISINFQTTV